MEEPVEKPKEEVKEISDVFELQCGDCRGSTIEMTIPSQKVDHIFHTKAYFKWCLVCTLCKKVLSKEISSRIRR